MCVRDEIQFDENDDDNVVAVNHMKDESYVPLAIVTTHRLALWEKNEREFDGRDFE